jgi:hypothetical protein
MSIKRVYFNILFVLFIVSFTSCKKGGLAESTTEPPKPVVQSFYDDLKIDSVQQRSIVVSYQLLKKAKITGVAIALDSITLANHLAGSTDQEAVFVNDKYFAKIQWPYNLTPTDDKIWFRLYVIDEDGTKTYSPVFGKGVAMYEVENKFVVNGKAIYNNHPKDFFINYEGGAIGSYDNSLIVDAITTDAAIENYRATLNDLPASVGRIDAVPYPESHKYILIDVPDDLPIGPAMLKFYYQDKLVYTEKLTIVNGGLLSRSSYPISRTYTGCFFEYGGKLFTYTNPEPLAETASFYSWIPETNVWEKLHGPKDLPYIDLIRLKGGKTINGTVYFNPLMVRAGATVPTYEEYILAYTPATREWKEKTLFITTRELEDRSMLVNDSFLYNDKLYCITEELPGGRMAGTIKHKIKIYDPANGSWEDYMDLPEKPYKWLAVSNNNQVYLLNTGRGEVGVATTEYVNEFYLLNVAGKSILKKNWIADREVGVNAPYLVSFRGKIYVYGGHYSSGYASLYSSLFAVYDPQQNKWSPVSGYSYFTGWVCQTDGFMLPIANKLYLGLGLDRYTNGNIQGSVVSSSVYQMALR